MRIHNPDQGNFQQLIITGKSKNPVSMDYKSLTIKEIAESSYLHSPPGFIIIPFTIPNLLFINKVTFIFSSYICVGRTNKTLHIKCRLNATLRIIKRITGNQAWHFLSVIACRLKTEGGVRTPLINLVYVKSLVSMTK